MVHRIATTKLRTHPPRGHTARRRVAVPAAVLLVLLPTLLVLPAPASAGWFSADVTVAESRAGDLLRFRQSVILEGGEARSLGVFPGDSEILVLVEGPGIAEDRFGVQRDVVTYRVERIRGGEVLASERCHMLRDGSTAVRRDVLAAEPYVSWSSGFSGFALAETPLVGRGYAKNFTALADFSSNRCDGFNPWPGHGFDAGDALFAFTAPYAPGVPAWGWNAHSAMATRSEFHGRAALTFPIDLGAALRDASGSLRILLADGLPGPARVSVDLERDTAEGRVRVLAETELVGLERGRGASIPGVGAASTGERHPDHRMFTLHDARAIDDGVFAFPLTFQEALDAAVADPNTRLAEYLRAHPDAVLVVAMYERHMRDAVLGNVREAARETQTDGGWILVFADRESQHAVIAQRTRGASHPGGVLDSPLPVVRAYEAQLEVRRAPARLPDEVLSLAGLARLLEASGVPPRDVAAFGWMLGGDASGNPYVWTFASDVPYVVAVGDDPSGRFVSVDGLSGGRWHVATTEQRTLPAGLLVVPAGGLASGGRGAFASALQGPAVGAGLAVTAVAGLALLALLAKGSLAALYTRLRRDRLLDHPVRAALHARVAQEPGIHLAALEAAVGAGEGATRHHLEHLVRARILSELRDGGFVRYFVAGALPPEAARREALLRAGSNRRVHDLFAQNPGLTLREAAHRLGMSAPSVHRAKRRLEHAGLLPQRPPQR